MSKCTNCNGEGLAGAGDKPWLKEGVIKTCAVCGGKGAIADSPEITIDTTPTEPVSEPAPENLEVAAAGGDSGSDSAPATDPVPLES